MQILNRWCCNVPCNKSRTHYRTFGYYTLVCPSCCIWNDKSHSNRVSIPLPTGLNTLGVHYQLRLCNYRDAQRYRLLLNIFYTTFIHIRYPIYSGLNIYTLCILHGHMFGVYIIFGESIYTISSPANEVFDCILLKRRDRL